MADKLRVVIYARFSSDNQKDTSIDDQVREQAAVVEARGWSVNPNLILSDYSVSGASVAREAFDRLYAMVKQSPPAVDVIVTESTDRISRDIGDAARFYKDAQFAGVRLICVKDGIDSFMEGARFQFNMRAVMSDHFLEDLGKKTLRGLEGQALRGFSTGGLPYGYDSVVVGDPKRPDGKKIIIDEETATIVVRIFCMYRDGYSFRSIAKALHDGGVPPPRAATKHRRKGWVAGTIREMLSNEAYVGRWAFKKKQWRKLPGTNKRRYKVRPDDEVLRFERPELGFIPEDLWDLVQRRRAAVAAKYSRGKAKKGKGVAGRRTSYPLSGLLKCGVCDAPMVIVGGSSARYYRCADNHKRGTCGNGQSLREDVLRAALLGELERLLVSDEGVVYARQTLAKKLGEASRSVDREKTRVQRQVSKVERQIDRLISFITGDDLDAKAMLPVKEALAQHQQELERLREEQASLTARATQPIELPTIEEVKQVVFDLKGLLESDPTRAREALRSYFKGGAIVLEPQDDGTYIAKSELLPLMVVPAGKIKKAPVGDQGFSIRIQR